MSLLATLNLTPTARTTLEHHLRRHPAWTRLDTPTVFTALSAAQQGAVLAAIHDAAAQFGISAAFDARCVCASCVCEKLRAWEEVMPAELARAGFGVCAEE